jgi:hypothetical protein
MITAIILASHDANALTRTLNALIGAAVEGLVRDVVVVASHDNEMAAKLADQAGCALVLPVEFAAAVRAAKGGWLMLLQSGALPEPGWEEAVSHHIQSGGGAARFRRSPLAARALFARLFQAERALALGLIIEKRQALDLGEAALNTPETLAKAAKAKPLPKPLSAALRPA